MWGVSGGSSVEGENNQSKWTEEGHQLAEKMVEYCLCPKSTSAFSTLNAVSPPILPHTKEVTDKKTVDCLQSPIFP